MHKKLPEPVKNKGLEDWALLMDLPKCIPHYVKKADRKKKLIQYTKTKKA